MKTPIVKGQELRPLNIYRWSAIKEYVHSPYGQRRETEMATILSYIALASSDNEKALHLEIQELAEAVIEVGMEITEEELLEVGLYMSKVLKLNIESEFTTEEGKVE